jgi:hypothetical protein
MYFRTTTFLRALLFFFFSIPGAGWLSAQTSMCNQLSIEVCEVPQPQGSMPQGCMDGDKCSPVYFYFYLKAAGTGGNASVSFKQMSVTGQLVATPNLLATSKVLSKLNPISSLQCSPPDINNPNDPASPTLSLDADDNFSYHVVDNNDLNINWILQSNRKLLFVIAVDPFPGEQVTLGGIAFSFVLPATPGFLCNGSIFYCNNILATKQIETPADCTSSLMVRIGNAVNAPVAGFPKRKRIPVIVTSTDMAPTLYNLEEMDVLLKLHTEQTMAEIFIEGGKIPANDILYYGDLPDTAKFRRIYANTEGLQLSVSQSTLPVPGNTLFYVVANGPELESDCAKIDLSITEFRRVRLSGTCCKPRAGLPDTISWNAGVCPDKCSLTKISVAEATSNLPAFIPCNNAFLDVFIEDTGSTVTYEEVNVSLLIEHSGLLNLDTAGCFSTYCSSMAFCTAATSMDSTHTRVDLSIDGSRNVELNPATGIIHFFRLALQGQDFCIRSVQIIDATLRKDGTSTYCLPSISSAIKRNIGSDDICTRSLLFVYSVYNDNPMRDINYSIINPGPCFVSGTADDYDSETICPCPADSLTFRPSKNNDHLNGVTTYDLVLISKHILGVEPLGSPYRMIAADANKSNSITTFDIVEFRKLILGIYDSVPNNTSWRFVPRNFVFTNPTNPWMPPIPEEIRFTIPPPTNQVSFYGIKIGDVNESAVLRSEPSTHSFLATGEQTRTGTNSSQIEVPIFAAEDLNRTAWQLSLRYDTSRFLLTGVRWPDDLQEYQGRDWHESEPGEVRVLWYDGTGINRQFPAGTPLFYLQFNSQSEIAAPDIQLATGNISSAAFDSDGTASGFVLQQVPSTLIKPVLQRSAGYPEQWEAGIYPNPASSRFRLELSLPRPSACRIVISDLYGRIQWSDTRYLETGYHSFKDVPSLPSGVYFVQFGTCLGSKTLRLVRD